jgi:hypothetical protein
MGTIKLYEAVQKWGQRLKKVVNCASPLALAKDFSLYYFAAKSKKEGKKDGSTRNKIYQKEYNNFPNCPFYEHIKVSMKRSDSGNKTTFEFSFVFRFDFKKVFKEVEPEEGTSNLEGGHFIKHFKIFDALERLIYDSGAFPKFCVIFWDVYYTIWKHEKFEKAIDTALTWANPRLYFDYKGTLQGGDYGAFVKRWDSFVTSYAREKKEDFIVLSNLAAYGESRSLIHKQHGHLLTTLLDNFFVPIMDYQVPKESQKASNDLDSEEPPDIDLDLDLEEYEFELPEEYRKLLFDLEHALDKQVNEQIYKQIASLHKKIEIKPILEVIYTKSKIIFSALLDVARNMPILLWTLREELAEQLKLWIITFITGYIENLDKLEKSEIAKGVDIDYSWVATDALQKTKRNS